MYVLKLILPFPNFSCTICLEGRINLHFAQCQTRELNRTQTVNLICYIAFGCSVCKMHHSRTLPGTIRTLNKEPSSYVTDDPMKGSFRTSTVFLFSDQECLTLHQSHHLVLDDRRTYTDVQLVAVFISMFLTNRDCFIIFPDLYLQ